MSQKINWEELSMQMITDAGSAKSSAMEAIFAAKANNFEEAEAKLASAEHEVGKASHRHFEVIVQEAQGVQHDFKVLFLHAEDQLLTTQTIILLAREFVEIYRKLTQEAKHKG